jgi:ribosome-associated protein
VKIHIEGPFIKLGQALKAAHLVSNGAEAKEVIQNGEVSVNEETEVRRGRKLVPGDVVLYKGQTIELM